MWPVPENKEFTESVRLAAAAGTKLHLSGVGHNDAVVVESDNCASPSHDVRQLESDAGVWHGNDAVVVESAWQLCIT